jgi:CxxC motif-containing protein (DUF1111 family)
VSEHPDRVHACSWVRHCDKCTVRGLGFFKVTPGKAAGDELRTAPLWGLGQRIFFLHAGRTRNLLSAIEAHSSSGSEANKVIDLFRGLSPSDKQNLIYFLRSL